MGFSDGTAIAVYYSLIKNIFNVFNQGIVLNITWLCEIAGVSRGGYCKWLAAEQHRVQIDEKDKEDFKQIVVAYRYRGYDKGVPESICDFCT